MLPVICYMLPDIGGIAGYLSVICIIVIVVLPSVSSGLFKSIINVNIMRNHAR